MIDAMPPHANPPYEVVIGLEVHAQISTKSKMFCGCDNDAFGKPPNTTVCPICMGHPGTLPAPNKEAVVKAVRVAQALKTKLCNQNHLDRKNYFYPDLPSGFQISQYDFPLAKEGEVIFGESKCCTIRRLHVENDAGKLTHLRGKTLCDFNRAGTPLMEIVTEPDLRSAEEAVLFAKELQRILIATGGSEADMYKGMMRFDASISLRPQGETRLYPRSEIKNLNSFKSLEKALAFEETRLRQLWEEKNPQTKEVTVHWDTEREVGEILRDKESAADYRYFPEPDIPPLHLDSSLLEGISHEKTELPRERLERYLARGLSEAEATLLVDDSKLATFYEEVFKATSDEKRTRSIVLSQLLGFLHAAGKSVQTGPTPPAVIELLQCVDQGSITANAAKAVLEKMVETGKDAKTLIAEEGLAQVADTALLERLVKEALGKHPRAVADVKAGNAKAMGALVGYIMKETNGQAAPTLVNELLQKHLGKM